jgi:hypothetical protein
MSLGAYVLTAALAALAGYWFGAYGLRCEGTVSYDVPLGEPETGVEP